MSLDMCLRCQRSIKVDMSCWHLKVQVRNSQKRYWLGVTLGIIHIKGKFEMSVWMGRFSRKGLSRDEDGAFGSILVWRVGGKGP